MNTTDKVAENDADGEIRNSEIHDDQFAVTSEEEDGLSVKIEGISDVSDPASEGVGD